MSESLFAAHQPTFDRLTAQDQAEWALALHAQTHAVYAKGHGDLPTWQNALAALPPPDAKQTLDLLQKVGVSAPTPWDAEALTQTLMAMHPWRKGPFHLNNIHIDTEWRSDWKWERIAPHINLQDKHVLDIGSGNGYYGWRMLGAGARSVLGIDPMLLFVIQFRAIQHFMGQDHPIDVLPLGIEALPRNLQHFDTVFSMGVLYHRRSPLDHLQHLAECLKPQGQLVIETLVVDGPDGHSLLPTGPGGHRYAQMRNVWFLPSVPTLMTWLRRAGFAQLECVDVATTSLEEQRSTPWMHFHSLKEFLDPKDNNKTIEGYPAPKRAVIIASKN